MYYQICSKGVYIMKLSHKEIFVTGLALFAMFLGAGNLIFPPMLGQAAGQDLWWATLGFVVTGVGLPLLGVAAVAKAGGDLEQLGNRVHPVFAKIITTIVVLCIGPLLAIPRTAATTFEVSIAPFMANQTEQSLTIGLVITTIVFFGLSLFVVLRPTKIVDNLGKILTPALIIFLAIIIIKGFLSPAGTIGESKYEAPFITGFLEGYNTLDALAAVIFGLVIANSVRAMGVSDNNEIAKVTTIAGVIAAIGLGSVYVGLSYIGATTGSIYTGSNHGEMLSFVSEVLLGFTGKVVIGVAMALACLTTAIGLIATCGSFFSRLTKNAVSYHKVCIITTLVSAVLANMGLAKILEISVPLLISVYPVVIVLVLLAIFHNLFRGSKTVYVWSVSTAVIFSLATLIDMLGIVSLSGIMGFLPLQNHGLGWVVPTALVTFVSLFFRGSESTATSEAKAHVN